MRRFSRWLTLFFVPFIFFQVQPSQAQAQGRVDCNALKSRILGYAVHYCVMLPPGYATAISAHSPKRYPVLYFLHGLGENEQILFQAGGWDVIQDLRQQGKIMDFLVVSPEGKGSFFINSADGRVRYSDFLLHEFIPFIEAHYSVRRERSGRAISGFSMGGYGALRLAFAHPELFSSVSAQSAALVTESPRQLNAEMHSGGELGKLLGRVFGDPINVSHWDQNSPFALAKQNRAHIAGLSIYFNCGTQDEFGFEKGAEKLHQQLQSEGIKHEFHLYPGHHSTTYFLAHLPEVLEFHSRAFATKK
jgi:S-formylglutathione hydrolase FrmB